MAALGCQVGTQPFNLLVGNGAGDHMAGYESAVRGAELPVPKGHKNRTVDRQKAKADRVTGHDKLNHRVLRLFL